MDRIEALARRIDPEAFTDSPPFPKFPEVAPFMSEPSWIARLFGDKPRDINEAERRAAERHYNDRVAVWTGLRKAKIELQEKAMDAARIAIGVSLILNMQDDMK